MDDKEDSKADLQKVLAELDLNDREEGPKPAAKEADDAFCEWNDSAQFAQQTLEELRAAEAESLREKMAALPTDDVHAYFRGVRGLLNDMSAKSEACEERICYLRQELPQKLETIRELRKQLADEKENVLKAVKDYEEKRASILKRLKEDAPDLLKSLDYFSSLKSELQLLQYCRTFLEAKGILKNALAESDFAAVFDAAVALQRSPDFWIKESDMECFRVERHKLLEEAKTSAVKEVQQIFKDIKYPLEADLDLRYLEHRMTSLATALKCCSYVASGKESISGCSLVFDLLFDPFGKRFDYHFFKERKTNADDKPEWFFAVLLSWFTANTPFMEKLFTLLFSDEDSASGALESFQKMLIGLATRKMSDILGRIVNDKVLFSHLIDEAVLFEKELKECGLLMSSVSALDVLCEEPFLSKWLELELESCRTGVETFLSNDGRWKQRYREVADTDQFRVPECTDQFILLLDSMTERYRWISNIELQAKFFGLQVLMLEEFHLRLVQISQQLSTPWEEPFMQLLNSFWYISCVLDEWADADVFLRVQLRNAGSRVRGVFAEIADIYKHVWRQRAADMCDAFMQHIKSQLTKYKNLKWFSAEAAKPADLTPSFCPFFLEVRRLVGRVASLASPDSAPTLFRMLNVKIAEALRDVVNSTSFNCNGAAQMLFDIISCLIPVLNSLYASSTGVRFEAQDEPLLEEVIVSLRLLSLPVATAILLRNELKQSPEEMAPSLLAAYDASILERDRVLTLFKQRCDIELDYSASIRL